MRNHSNSLKKSNIKCLITACILLIGAGLITFYVAEIYGTSPTPIDIRIQEIFFSFRNTTLNQVVCFITHFSDVYTIVGFCALLLILPTRKKYGLPISLACLLGVSIYMPMKHIILRARPEEAVRLVVESGYSFPSGHSVTSIVFYGLALYLVNRHCKNPKMKIVLSVICVFFMLLIGPSRIFVGVHWHTDVLAGWCIGGAVLAAMIIMINVVRGRR